MTTTSYHPKGVTCHYTVLGASHGTDEHGRRWRRRRVRLDSIDFADPRIDADLRAAWQRSIGREYDELKQQVANPCRPAQLIWDQWRMERKFA